MADEDDDASPLALAPPPSPPVVPLFCGCWRSCGGWDDDDVFLRSRFLALAETDADRREEEAAGMLFLLRRYAAAVLRVSASSSGSIRARCWLVTFSNLASCCRCCCRCSFR